MRRFLTRVGAKIGRTIDGAGEGVAAWVGRRQAARWTTNPIAAAPIGSAADYEALWQQARREENVAVDEYEASMGVAVDRDWFHQLAKLTQVSIKKSSVCYFHGRLLYASLRRYAADHPGEALTVVETGTARGFGTLCLARALDDASAPGKVFTFDVLPHERPIYWNSISDAQGRLTRAQLLSPYASLLERYAVFTQGDTRATLGQIAFPRVHFAFLDSVHTYDHVMAEFAAIRGRQRRGDVLFFDDYTPSAYPGVVKAADEICAAEGYTHRLIGAGEHRAYLIARKD